MQTLQLSLLGLGSFFYYFATALVLLLIFKFLYAMVTPHDEWKLVKEEKNTAAAIGFSGAMIGFSIALANAANQSVSLLDFIIWGIVALGAQCLAFAILRFVFLPKVVERIKENEVSAGVILAGFSIAVGFLNAACMSY